MLKPKWKKISGLIRTSFDAADRDYTTGSLKSAIVLLSVPMILELIFESVFAVVDMYVVSHLPNSTVAMATVGLTESMITLVYSVAIGLSTAATALVARRTGEKDYGQASKTGGQVLLIGGLSAVLISLFGAIFASDLLRLMGASQEVISQGSGFTRVMFAGSASILGLFLINGIFRGAGNAAMAMRSLWLASLLNLALCPLLVFGWGPVPALGLIGAAWATTVGRSVGVIFQLYHLFKPGHHLRVLWSHLQPDVAEFKHILSIAWPATLQFLIQSGSWIVLAYLVASSGGTEASAGYQLAIRNIVFFILPAWGLSNAAATLVGQHLGAGLIDRAVDSVWLTARYNAFFMGTISVLFMAFPFTIVGWYDASPAVANIAAKALRIIGAGYVFYGIGMVMIQALNGAGDTRTPTWINLGGFWFFQIPLAYILVTGLGWKETGAFIAIPAAETLVALVAWFFFRQGKWKQTRV